MGGSAGEPVLSMRCRFAEEAKNLPGLDRPALHKRGWLRSVRRKDATGTGALLLSDFFVFFIDVHRNDPLLEL